MLSKKIVQDIVPANRRSINSIKLKKIQKNPDIDKIDELREKKVNIVDKEDEDLPPIVTRSRLNANNKNRKNNKTKSYKILFTFVIILICISIIGIALSFLYTKAVITITPIKLNLNINGDFTVKKDTVSNDQLKYEIITVTAEAKKIVPATNGPLIETKAKGTVLLFNNSAISQKIIAGTRISNNKGLIYRTTSSVTIPAKKTVAGSVSVDIVADKAGENYNIKLTDLNGDFKVVAYKDTSKYTLFYGRLTKDIIGGYSGNKKIISAELQKSTEAELQNELKSKLISQIKPIVPKNFVLFDNAYTIEYKTLDSVSTSSENTDINIQGILSGIIFDKNLLLNTVASKEIKAFPAKNYDINGLENLNFKISNIKDFSIAKNTPLIFNLKGTVNLVAIIDENKLKNQLKGVLLSNSNTVFKDYNSIGNAHARITPFWMRSFPNSTESIIINYNK